MVFPENGRQDQEGIVPSSSQSIQKPSPRESSPVFCCAAIVSGCTKEYDEETAEKPAANSVRSRNRAVVTILNLN